MKQLALLTVVFVLVLASLTFAGDKTELRTEKERISYALGMEIGVNIDNIPHDLDLDIFIQGIKDQIQGKKLLLSKEESEQIKKNLVKKIQEERALERKELSEKNRKEGEAFLEENKNKDGVTTTDSGLQYMVLTKGDGPNPAVTDKVKVHYSGTLLNGTEFDSSYSRGQPATFPLNGVIKGWTEGLQLMNVGSKYRFFIPSHLAYGERGAGPQIGPYSTLIFEVELLEIVK